jgi:hypothetical protein
MALSLLRADGIVMCIYLLNEYFQNVMVVSQFMIRLRHVAPIEGVNHHIANAPVGTSHKAFLH